MTVNTPQQHSKFSASAASRWINCPGSMQMSLGIPNTSSAAAEEGTVAHELAALCLLNDQSPWEYDKYQFLIKNGKYFAHRPNLAPAEYNTQEEKDREKQAKNCNIYEVDQEMIEHIRDYIDYVATYATIPSAKLHVEERVNYSKLIDVPSNEAFGTSDIIIAIPDQKEIVVCDLKYGHGEVKADNNPQLMLYALGAYQRYKFLYDIEHVRMVVFQPRIENLSEWDVPLEHLLDWVKTAKAGAYQAKQALANPDKVENYLNPGVDQCKWCLAKATCPALAKNVLETTAGSFEPMAEAEELLEMVQNSVEKLPQRTIDQLSKYMKATDLIEMWVKGVREAVFRHLDQGHNVPGFKMVQGRKPARKWLNGDKASIRKVEYYIAQALMDENKEITNEKLFKDMYDRKIKTAPQMEKLLKKEDPDLWEELEREFVTQGEPSNTVVPESDGRKRIYKEDVGASFEPIPPETKGK